MTLVLEDEDVWNIEDGDVFDYQINVGTGSELHYTADRTDSGSGYLMTGGTVKIDAGVVLTSDSCNFNESPINDNTTGALYYVDEIGALGSWTVTGGGGSGGYDKIRRRKSALGRIKSISSK